jgi:Ca-activated chloride channel family protein
MPKNQDYYSLLGLPRNASQEEIRKAYFEAARRLHPDRNTAPGETEFFLDIQEAYEVLSNPQKRANYDAALAPEKSTAHLFKQKILFSRKSLLDIPDPQLIYVLLEYTPNVESDAPPAPPLNLCLILDRSTSMRGLNMDMLKATAIQVMRRLRSQDTFSLIVFSDRPETIIPATRSLDFSKLEARIQMLQPSGGTEIFPALESGFAEVSRSADSAQVNHIILITDGRTYGDEEKCLSLAQKAAGQGIGISGLGIGHEWNDAFLDELASRTGGSSMYVASPQDIQRVLLDKFSRLGKAYAEETKLEFALKEGVELRYAFRLQPEAGLLPIASPIPFGPILCDGNLKILMELGIKLKSANAESVILIEGKLYTTVHNRPTPLKPITVNLVRPITKEAGAAPPPAQIMDALSKLTLYRLQEQARLEVKAGEFNRASEHLQQLATHLLAQGERGLARTVLLEAERIHQQKSLSEEGNKEIKYGTRALLMAGEEKDIQ